MPESKLITEVNCEPARFLLGKAAADRVCGLSRCRLSSAPSSRDGLTYSLIRLRDVERMVITITPQIRGGFREQAGEVIRLLRRVLGSQSPEMVLTAQTVFLNSAAHQSECERLFREYYGDALPVTHYVIQPPCSGSLLALEAWGIGGTGVVVEHHTPRSLSVSYGGVRWIHCASTATDANVHEAGAYQQTRSVLQGLTDELQAAEAELGEVVRTWLYLGQITAEEEGRQRYRELNHARTDVFADVHFGRALKIGRNGNSLYPAGTGIGMQSGGLQAGCLALQTTRSDVRLVALENPGQVPAYCYEKKYSPQSPKFSRAMVVLLDGYATTWISGTASIVNSESVFPGDIERQTHQTLDNIERLIAPENFALHGVPRAGATLEDLAKVRVYVKRPQDYVRCCAVCEERLGDLPVIYALADVCRPELLVEIEGVAFSPLGTEPAAKGKGRE